MRTRRLFVYSGLLALLITGTAFAGRYQRTKDGTARVWNENPKAGDLVTWSGARDAKGYATGFGTVTWFTPQNEVETGSGVAAWLRHVTRQRHYTVSRSASGIMVQGKLEEAAAAAESKKRKRTDISEQRSTAPSTDAEAKPTKPQPSPAQEKATSPTPTPANDSLESLMHVPHSLKLNSAAGASPLPSNPSPTATPDNSVQLSPASSPTPSPSP